VHNFKNSRITELFCVFFTGFVMLALGAQAEDKSVGERHVDESLRDPTKPLTYSAKSEQKYQFNLQAIYNRGTTRSAVVNGKSLVVGDIFQGYRVSVIAAQSIKLVSSEGSLNINLREKVLN
jgi:MSHA biogenesis protein MshK